MNMKIYALAVTGILCLAAVPANAQSVVKICVLNTANSGCTPVDSNNPLPVTGGGGGGGGTSSTFGAAFPATGTASGFKDSTGTNMVPGNLTAGGALKVDSSATNQPENLVGINSVTPAVGNGTTNTGTQRVTLSSDSTGQVAVSSSALPSGAATSANQTTANSSLATIATNSGSPIPAGSALIGKVGIDQTTPGTTNAVQNIAGTSGGASTLFSASVTNTAQSVKGSAGQVYWYYIANTNTSICYLQIYNVASGSVTVGTTTPTLSIGIPANSSSPGAANSDVSIGLPFATAISVAASTTRAGASACTNGLDVNVAAK